MSRYFEIDAQVVRTARILKGLTQEALAEAAGLGLRTIKRLEKGGAVARLSNSRALASALGVKHEEMVIMASPAKSVAEVSAESPADSVKNNASIRVDKDRVLEAATQAIVDGKVSEHYREEFSQSVRDLSFKDLDFLIAFQDGLRRHMERHQKFVDEKKVRPDFERVGKNYRHAHTVNRLHAPHVNRLIYHGALSQPLADMPSAITPFGNLLYEVLGPTIREIAEEMVENYWLETRNKVFKDALNVRTGKREDMSPPPGGWLKEQLRRNARPWVGNLMN